MKQIKISSILAPQVAGMMVLFFAMSATAEAAAEIDQDVDVALAKLYSGSPAAKALSKEAKGVLVFPNVIKGGLILGGQYGVGALLVNGKTEGYYSTAAASYGLQVGAQSFGYAMIFMKDTALDYLETSAGWEVGVGPSVVVVDDGLAQSMTTSTAQDDIYVFFFSQTGLMAGLGVQGSKITQFQPDK